jgi:hypothetical protein
MLSRVLIYEGRHYEKCWRNKDLRFRPHPFVTEHLLLSLLLSSLLTIEGTMVMLIATYVINPDGAIEVLFVGVGFLAGFVYIIWYLKFRAWKKASEAKGSESRPQGL